MSKRKVNDCEMQTLKNMEYPIIMKYHEITLAKRIIRKIVSTIFPRTSIVSVDGGLGSQIFKYAFGLSLEKMTNCKVMYDVTWFSKNGRSIDNRNSRIFQLSSVFPNIKIKKSPWLISKIYKKYFYYDNNKMPFFYHKGVFVHPPRYYGGYYNNCEYFKLSKEKLKRDLIFNSSIREQELDFQNLIKSAESAVAVHIRRGDYINSAHDVLNEEYYRKAIEVIQKQTSNITIFFFSNDSEWVTKNITPLLSVDIKYYIYQGNNDTGWIDMYLMSLCGSIITANSSFSWIPAWLNKENSKQIILPKIWFKEQDSFNTKGIESAFNIKNATYI